MKRSVDKVSGSAFAKEDYYRKPTGRVDAAILQKNLDMQHQSGFLKTPLDVKPYMDLSLVDDAAKRLE